VPRAPARGAPPGDFGIWNLRPRRNLLFTRDISFFFQKEGCLMLVPGTAVTMTKGYKDLRGVISYRTDSKFEIYVITLTTGMKVAAGPSSFTVVKK
jgi:hypothetical protein